MSIEPKQGIPVSLGREGVKNAKCDGCRHNWYSAPGGQEWNRAPHSRCLLFKADIPMAIEKLRGCDGRLTPQWVRSEIPKDCPTYLHSRLF